MRLLKNGERRGQRHAAEDAVARAESPKLPERDRGAESAPIEDGKGGPKSDLIVATTAGAESGPTPQTQHRQICLFLRGDDGSEFHIPRNGDRATQPPVAS